MVKRSALPFNLPPRFLGLDAAAEYFSLSSTKFDSMAESGQAPKAKRIGRRKMWDRLELDRWADALGGDNIDVPDDSWKD